MKTKLGIYGGTYAPVHNGHIAAAHAFKEKLELDRLMIVPANIPPHKELPKEDSPLHRLNMLRLAFEGCEGIEISTFELDREGKSYSVDTLRHFSSEDTELYFLIGTDMLLCMHMWYKVEEIAQLATLVYTRRECDPCLDTEIQEQTERLEKDYGFSIKELVIPPIVISSTEVRAAKDRTPYIPKEVERYIREHRLYVQ